MLQTVLADFRAWGGATVTTTRDRRLADVSLPADRIIDLDPSADHYITLAQLARQFTAALIIAPESGGILERLSALMEGQGVRLLGSSSGSIATAANKWDCYQLFRQAELPTPVTWSVSVKKARETAEKIGFPLVIKPIDGVGCEGVRLIRDIHALLLTLEEHRFHENQLLLQRYITGQHISASLLLATNNTACLSLNKQSIKIGTTFTYQGGEVPFICGQHDEAIALAKKAVTLIPGLKGYVGVDMLINDEGCFLIEINPRLTSSYIGLRQVVNVNLAEAIWNASVEDLLPQEIFLSGKAVFGKEVLP